MIPYNSLASVVRHKQLKRHLLESFYRGENILNADMAAVHIPDPSLAASAVMLVENRNLECGSLLD